MLVQLLGAGCWGMPYINVVIYFVVVIHLFYYFQCTWRHRVHVAASVAASCCGIPYHYVISYFIYVFKIAGMAAFDRRDGGGFDISRRCNAV